MDSQLLGQRIRQARDHKSMSQEELAAAVGREQGAISEYESGKRRLAAVDLPLFATALEVPLSYFFEEDAPVYDSDAAMLNYLHLLPTPEDRQAAVDIVRILSNRMRESRT